jgi:hypothetical protein
MNGKDDKNAQPRQQPDPRLPDPPEPRKSMEIRAADVNMPEPPPPMLSEEAVPDDDR